MKFQGEQADSGIFPFLLLGFASSRMLASEVIYLLSTG